MLEYDRGSTKLNSLEISETNDAMNVCWYTEWVSSLWPARLYYVAHDHIC